MSDKYLTQDEWDHAAFAKVKKENKIDMDIIKEIMKLRQKVADMETAKSFSVSIFDNITQRLTDIEKRQKDMDATFLKVIELRGMRGTT